MYSTATSPAFPLSVASHFVPKELDEAEKERFAKERNEAMQIASNLRTIILGLSNRVTELVVQGVEAPGVQKVYEHQIGVRREIRNLRSPQAFDVWEAEQNDPTLHEVYYGILDQELRRLAEVSNIAEKIGHRFN